MKFNRLIVFFLVVLLNYSETFSQASPDGEKMYLQCEPAKSTENNLTYSFAAFADIDSYSTKTVRSCKRMMNPESCLATQNIVFCKKPKNSFSMKSLNNRNSIFIVSDRCNGNFIKYSSIDDNNDRYPLILFEDKMLFQIKNQIFAGTTTTFRPVLIISKPIPSDRYFDLEISDFLDQHWNREWTGENWRLDYFSVNSEDAFSLNTRCKSFN